MFDLPSPIDKTEVSVEEALAGRKSIRHFSDELISLQEAAQVLWAASQINRLSLDIFLFARKVEILEPGVYGYLQQNHQLSEIETGDFSKELVLAADDQVFLREASACLIVSTNLKNTVSCIAAGQVAENVYLQVQSLKLGTTLVNDFDAIQVKNILNLSGNEILLYLMPIGRPK